MHNRDADSHGFFPVDGSVLVHLCTAMCEHDRSSLVTRAIIFFKDARGKERFLTNIVDGGFVDRMYEERGGGNMLSRHRSAGMQLAILVSGVAISALGNVSAHGFMLKHDGNGIHLEVPSALCLASADGQATKLITVGAAAPGGGTISNIGMPAFESDGSILFGAQISGSDKTEWRILRANVAQPDRVRIDLAMGSYAATPDCQPVLKVDPYVIAGGDGSIAFIADRRGGGGALFHYAHGRMECEIRTGDRTGEGHPIASLGFGSARGTGDGATVLQVVLAGNGTGSIRADRNAILLVRPGAPALEIAVQGNRSRDGVRFGGHFGLPSVSFAGDRVIVAFTNQTDSGSALFVGPPEGPVRTFGAGSSIGDRAITYLSDGRPSLAKDGSVALEAAAGRHRLIVIVRDGEPSVVASERIAAVPGDERMESIGEPIANVSGRIYAESIDQNGDDRISILPGAQSMSVLRDVFPLSADVDSSGKVAFLASQPDR